MHVVASRVYYTLGSMVAPLLSMIVQALETGYNI